MNQSFGSHLGTLHSGGGRDGLRVQRVDVLAGGQNRRVPEPTYNPLTPEHGTASSACSFTTLSLDSRKVDGNSRGKLTNFCIRNVLGPTHIIAICVAVKLSEEFWAGGSVHRPHCSYLMGSPPGPGSTYPPASAWLSAPSSLSSTILPRHTSRYANR